MSSSRYATFIDAGHLRAAIAFAAAGMPAKQMEIEFEPVRLSALLREAAARMCPHATFTRHFFYDGSNSLHPAPSHDMINRHGDFVLRLGKMKDNGQQKGVDTMLALDMALKASDRVIDDVILLGGDYDLVPGFDAAKDRGARVHLIDLRAANAPPCRELFLAADSVDAWTIQHIASAGVARIKPAADFPRESPAAVRRVVHAA